MTRHKAQSTTILSQSQKLVPRQPWHRWTDEELNLLAYCRTRHWSYARIQRKHFPLLTESSLWGAYSRIPPKERAHRASIVAGSITTSRTASRNKDSARPHPIPETGHRSHPAPQPEGNIGVRKSSALRGEEDSQTLIPIDGTNRYNFRPNRCGSFQESETQYPIDRLRFPHFFESYKNHLKLDGVPDGDYAPPPHSPTPDSSDRSPSVISSLPSAASSLELFGLEARSLCSSDHDSLVTPSLPNEGSSPEFFSSEERPPTP